MRLEEVGWRFWVFSVLKKKNVTGSEKRLAERVEWGKREEIGKPSLFKKKEFKEESI